VLPVIVGAEVPLPAIEGPITSPGTIFLTSTSFDLATVGYTQAEYFITGTAHAYTNAAPLGRDGRWSVEPGDSAGYRTRIVVYRPSDPKKFNGTVIVEWLNVSGGVDSPPDWIHAHTALIRGGFAWVGVSAQIVGVEGGAALTGVVSLPLKTVDPARYGSLHHPGDSFSYDIFSQAGAAVRQRAGPLGGLAVKRLIAAGKSQSAFRLVTYIDAVHPLAHVYDGFLVHSRSAVGAYLSESPQPTIAAPSPTLIRTDVDVPVLTLQTETEVVLFGYRDARQSDGRHLRLWEAAGTAHYDTYGLVNGPADRGTSPDAVALIVTTTPVPGYITCPAPVNSGPQHFVTDAAFVALDRWVRHGRPPKPAPRFDLTSTGIVRDAHDNAIGGIRTPQVDVPIATFTGEQPGPSILCVIFGTTAPFGPATLAALYPTHEAFVSAYARSLRHAVRAGWILKADAKLMKRWAVSSDVGR
jgi:hypothetical protein